jgi:urease accessory protein
MNTTRISRFALFFAALLLIPTFAQAHVGVGSTHGFVHGIAHPFSGLDHLCAMMAVGLWAAQRGGRALWAVPLSFLSVMVVGAALGMAGVTIPFVEQGIVASVLLLGVLVAAAVRLPVAASAILVGLFALFHGHAHGTEMPVTASGFAYGAGFLVATTLLHTAGIGLGMTLQRVANSTWVRAAGGAIAFCGLYLIVG